MYLKISSMVSDTWQSYRMPVPSVGSRKQAVGKDLYPHSRRQANVQNMAELRCPFVHLILVQISESDRMKVNFNRRACACFRPIYWPDLLASAAWAISVWTEVWSDFNKAKHHFPSTFGLDFCCVICWWKPCMYLRTAPGLQASDWPNLKLQREWMETSPRSF